MTNFIINPKSVSYIEIRADLIAYFNSLPDASEWSLFLSSAAGARIMDLLAAVCSFNKFDTITARREGFIQFAQNRSSIIGKAQDFGYSAYRGRNKVIKLTITPATTGVWAKYTYLGSVKDKFLVLESDTVVNAGVDVSVNVIIGEVLSESKFASGTILNSFRYSQVDVSEDMRMYIDGDEVAFGTEIQDALDGKFQIQSNTFRSVDAKYLNLSTFEKQYIVGSEIKLDYIPLKDVSYTNTDLNFYPSFGTFLAIEDVSLFTDVETDDSIRTNAPIKNETTNAVRAREDQPKIFRKLNPDILDATGIDVTDAVMKIFLLRKDGLNFSFAEMTAMQAAFEKYRPNGLLPPLIDNTQPSHIKLKFTLKLVSGSTTVPANLIDTTLVPYKNKLGAAISLADLENSIEDDQGVKTARVEIIADAWAPTHNYSVGDYIAPTTPNGFVYRLSQIKNSSGGSEPAWPVVAGNTIVDNHILWKAIAKNDLAGISAWQANTFYNAAAIFNKGLGSVVKPTSVNGFIYEAVDYIFKSGGVEPTWTANIGDRFSDGRVIWICRALLGTPAAWAANTNHKAGDLVKATSGFLTVMFQAVGYQDLSSGAEPTWPTVIGNTVAEGSLVWLAQQKDQDEHKIGNDQWFIITYQLVVS